MKIWNLKVAAVSCMCLSLKDLLFFSWWPNFYSILSVFALVFWRMALPFGLISFYDREVLFVFSLPGNPVLQTLIPLAQRVGGWMLRLWDFLCVWMSKDASCLEFKTWWGRLEAHVEKQGKISEGSRSRGMYCLIPLTKKAKHTVIWQPFFFHQRLKLDKRKRRKCHILNSDQHECCHWSLWRQRSNKWSRLWVLALVQLWREMVCTSFWVSCCRICISLLGQSHSTAYMLWYGTVLF